ncbi:MAG: SpoIIE family protein phosphatase [Flavobacteriales bacterium]|nr:SpoIIE family protein phosphatase [Flavobacteriales bacterium]MCB9448739.1 SpoIIE family protein phosphatase [Flavobacteriales bacterium]
MCLRKICLISARTLLVFLACLSCAYAGNATRIPEADVQAGDIQYVIDKGRVLTLDSLRNREMEPYDKLVPNFGFMDGAVWFRFTVTGQPGEVRILELKNPNLDLVDVFAGTHGKILQQYHTGDLFPFIQRPVQHRFFQFPLYIPDGGRLNVLLRVDNHGDQFFIPIAHWTKEALARRDYNEQFALGIYYGLLIFVLLLNLFIYLIIGERANLYYILYVFGLFMLQFALGGHGVEYLWNNNPYVAQHAAPFLASATVLFLIIFAVRFLNMHNIMPRFGRIFTSIGWLIFVNCFLALLPMAWTYKLSILSINLLTFILNLTIIPVTVYAMIKLKYKPARFFLVAFVALSIGVFAFILRNAGIAPSHVLTDFSLQIGSALEVILLSFAIVDKFKMFKNEALLRLEEMNRLKSEQNILLEQQVKERTNEINQQKEELADKNKEILDSIAYAKRIQEAILPPDDALTSQLPNGFVYYQPKDIVAGDFYWVEKLGDQIMFAVADCTGHGVPGAMVSVVCHNALNRAVREFRLTDPAAMLDQVRGIVTESFETGGREVNDGMDIALCILDPHTRKLHYAGANNPLYLVRNGKLHEYKPDKQPVGKYVDRKPFVSHLIECLPGDSVYIFSDGFPDQFGGPKGKKFKYGAFKKLLMEISADDSVTQRHVLEKTFVNWKGDLPQVDDVCVMGLIF